MEVAEQAAPTTETVTETNAPGHIPEGMIDLDAPQVETQDTAAKTEQTERARNEKGQFTKSEAAAETPSGTEDATVEAETPIDAPTSWNADDKEWFKSQPRATQEILARREKERDTETNRRLQEDAERTKQFAAKERAVEEARTRFEQATAQALQQTYADILRDFPEVGQPGFDMEKLSNEDPFKALNLRARLEKAQMQNNQFQQLQHAKRQEAEKQFAEWARAQDEAFSKKHPDFTDSAKSEKARGLVKSYLSEAVGLKPEELANLWNGERAFRDARTQAMIYDAARFWDAQKQAKAAIPVAKPAPQKPGSPAANGGSSVSDAAERGDMARFIAMRNKGLN